MSKILSFNIFQKKLKNVKNPFFHLKIFWKVKLLQIRSSLFISYFYKSDIPSACLLGEIWPFIKFTFRKEKKLNKNLYENIKGKKKKKESLEDYIFST